MAQAAHVVVSPISSCVIGEREECHAKSSVWLTIFDRAAGLGHVADRLRAKFSFHDSRRYRALVGQAFQLSGLAIGGPQVFARLRRLDSDGLGIWYLAQGGRQPRLEEVCRKAIALPGIGLPRAIARSLDRAWAGEMTCWFGESTGFDALVAETLISAGQAATLVAVDLTWPGDAETLARAANQLTRTANAVQTAGRAAHRVIGRSPSVADETTRWLFQSVNLLRRALNHTDLLAVDEQIARESARQALAAASSAAAAAISLSSHTPRDGIASEAAAARNKLSALARTVDALASRVSASLRSQSPPLTTANFIVEQSGRILTDATKALRPWHIELPCAAGLPTSSDLGGLCARANDLAESSSEVLEAWAILHELSIARDGASARLPGWADRLVQSIAGAWTGHEVAQWLGAVSGRCEQAVAAAVGLTVLRCGSLQLRRELWRLMRAPRCTALERSLAFQLFWRLDAR
jgi:hypothetical protein